MKKIILLIILIFIAALAFNIKTVPNYSNKYGFEIVTSIGYNKYQQGYCLSENRILPFKEKATRAILQFMDKKVVLHKKFTEFKCYKFGLSYCDYRDRKIEIGYYILDELTNENWHDVILSGFDPEYRLEADNHGAGYRKLFFEDLNATKVTNLEDYIAFDEDMRYAGFTRPILQYIGDRDYFLYLD
ncbi:MAG: hypothetical protein LBP54_06915, partial [Campylobacteraceae bacterium]|nr:hypothetical protein [Campylobacteraceae bacterium]